MALNRFFRYPFARSGDKTAIPDPVVGTGEVSYDQGYGPDYQRAKTDPLSKNIERDKMNSLFSDITTALQEYQTNGTPDWITNAQNGGVAYPYPIGARVRYTDGLLYISTVAANTNLPNSGTGWLRDGGRFLRRRVITTTGTLNLSADAGFCLATVVGGGGGAGGSAVNPAGQWSAAAGGGGGGWAMRVLTKAQIAGQTGTVGAGGAGGVITTPGTAGGTTSIGALLSATGGGASNAAGSSNGVAALGFAPAGVGSGGDLNFSGGVGRYALYSSGPTSGEGGASYGGAGAGPVTGGYFSGNPGPGYGCGGSGGAGQASTSGTTGGSGAAGVIILDEYA